MLREQCRVGQKVYFGRETGEKTLGVIEKLNPTKAKVRTLEERGRGRGAEPGAVWVVPYSMITPAYIAQPFIADGAVAAGPAAPQPVQPALKYNQFQAAEDVLILQAISECYGALSPENLACDGEASRTHIQRRGAELNRKLRGLFAAFGRTVTEEEAYEWDDQRRNFILEERKRREGKQS